MDRQEYDNLTGGAAFYGETIDTGYDSEIKIFQKPKAYNYTTPQLESGLYEMGTEVERHFKEVKFIEYIAPCSKVVK